jgi:hypothetical protein
VAEYHSLYKLYKEECKTVKRESWKKFCSQTKGLAEMANLAKIIKYHPKYAIGLLKDPHTSILATSPEATMDILTSTSFPGSRIARTEELVLLDIAEQSNRKGLFKPIQAEWRTSALTKDAIASFGANKAAGPDGFKPIALQSLPDICLDKLVLIYDAVMTAGYTPLIWRSARVVYIPKIGKTDYALAKSYRPISLTPFLFKGLERLVHWHLQETTLTT